MRIGLGYDNHRLVPGRPLMLGGVQVPSPVGADAHSDGDVLIHALVDALLGAAGLGDIGTHFPDTDPRWKGQASRLFLERAAQWVLERGWGVLNVDATVVLQEVRLRDHKRSIAANVRQILAPWHALAEDAVNIKAKTNERMDSIGEGKALAAHVAVLLVRSSAGGGSAGPSPAGTVPSGER